MPEQDHTVCVVIAAYRAEGTIAEAVSSALREPQTAEVVVVDDHSDDGTASQATSADDGSGRLRVIRLEQNGGPARARNVAIAASRSDFISILDADDLFLPNRFEALLGSDDWDLIADNIAFVDAAGSRSLDPEKIRFDPQPRFLKLVDFVDGNISRRGRQRGEIGFLKPLMRRSFLDRHGLQYNEAMRLGEDYDLYARALACGARYKIVNSCGYVAVVRGESLSGSHRTEDLQSLYEADREMLAAGTLGAAEHAAVLRHERHVRARYELRHFLDLKRQKGAPAAALHALSRPAALPAIALGIAADKLDAMADRYAPARSSVAASTPRFLFPAQR